MIIIVKKIFLRVVISICIILSITCSTALMYSKIYTSYNMDNVEDGINLPIIMYHSILNSAKRTSKYIITPGQLEDDLKYIQQQGYTTVFVKDIVEHVYNDTPLPQKPIMLTFDDGYYNNYSYLFPLLQKYNMKAVISIIGTDTDVFTNSDEVLNNNYSHITWPQLAQMQESGLVEIQNHSYNQHSTTPRKGILRKKGEDVQEYKEYIIKDILLLQDKIENNLGMASVCFTYPFGYIDNEASDIIKELGFKASLSCYEGMNLITDDPECLYALKRYNRSGKVSSISFFRKIFN